MKDVQDKILQVYDSWVEKKVPSWIDYLPVGEESHRIYEVTGIVVEGYTHVIESTEIQHALKGHGETGEFRFDQISITRDDFAKIPMIIKTADHIEYAGKSKRRNLDVIRYIKKENGVTYILEEVRRGRKKLAFLTMYKKTATSGRVGATTD
jgi:hypothetical protein